MKEGNEFGFRDDVLSKSRNLIDEFSLRKLAAELRQKVLKEKEKIKGRDKYSEACNLYDFADTLKSCALALKDPFLYEEAEKLLLDEEPKGKILFEIVGIFVRFKKYKDAEKRILELPNEKSNPDALELLETIYEETSDKEKLLDMWSIFYHNTLM